jgi:hypothetical protein
VPHESAGFQLIPAGVEVTVPKTDIHTMVVAEIE